MKRRPLSPPGSELLTAQDLAIMLNIHERTVFAWVASGKLPQPIRASKRVVRWRRAEVQEMLEKMKQPA